ncbi:MAG: hypothetical protein WCD28_07100, partial [Nitrososphaeraceae archaeon]
MEREVILSIPIVMILINTRVAFSLGCRTFVTNLVNILHDVNVAGLRQRRSLPRHIINIKFSKQTGKS